MDNKSAKRLIERTTPVKEGGYLPFNVFPWTKDFMCPYGIGEIRKSSRVMKKLSKRLGAELYANVEAILDECEANFIVGITRHHEGTNESDMADDELLCNFIDEHENGGFGGDSYSGYGYLKVSKKDYLKYSYAM
jgi:hypothetical protein